MIELLSKALLYWKNAPSWIVVNIRGRDVVYMQVEKKPLDFWPNEILNKKQFAMYKIIVDYKTEHGYAPIYSELVELSGHAIATVQKRIKEIQKLGLITYHGGRAISIHGELYTPPWPVRYLEEKDELSKSDKTD